MPEVIDHVARQQITSHEAECVRRFADVKEDISGLKDEVRDVKRIIESRATLVWTFGGAAVLAGINGLFQLLKPLVHP